MYAGSRRDSFRRTFQPGAVLALFLTLGSSLATAQAVLSISQSPSAATVNPGDTVTFTVTYGNSGLAAATNVVIVETLPANLTFVSATGAGAYDAGTRRITWTAASLAAATLNQQVAFDAAVASSGAILEGGTITNSSLTITATGLSTTTASPVGIAVNDKGGPTLANPFPAASAWNAARDTLIQFHLLDAGSGVDASTVTADVRVNGLSVSGVLRSAGTAADTRFVFQADEEFDYERPVEVRVNGSDLSGNAMAQATFAFTTEVRVFGANFKVDNDISHNDHAATACDSDGTIWIVWERVVDGRGRILLTWYNKHGLGSIITVLADSTVDRRRPVMAISPSNQIVVLFEEDDGNSVYIQGAKADVDSPAVWTRLPRAIDLLPTASDQHRPALAIDAEGTMYLASQATVNGVEQVAVLALVEGADDWTAVALTTGLTDKADPAVAVDSNGKVYVVWASGGAINGVVSTAWTSVHGVGGAAGYTLSAPKVATESTGDTLHFAWVAQPASGAPALYYATHAGGLPATTLGNGTAVQDGAGILDTAAPVLVVSGTGASAKAFLAWHDRRSTRTGDTDIEFAETKAAATLGTNVMVSNDEENKPQTNPALALDDNGVPYIVWTDDRTGDRHIYFSRATHTVDVGNAWTIGAGGGNRTFEEDDNDLITKVNVDVPAGVFPTSRRLNVREIHDLRKLPGDATGVYVVIGPGTDERLSDWVTVTIEGITVPSAFIIVRRWRPPTSPLESGSWTDDDIRDAHYLSATHKVIFETKHLSTFAVSEGTATDNGGGGGGGCTMARGGTPDLMLLLLPAGAVALGLALRRRTPREDRR